MLDMNKIRYCAEHLSESGLRQFVTYLATEVNLAMVRKAAGFTSKPVSLDSWVATAEVDATPGLRDKLVARKAKIDSTIKGVEGQVFSLFDLYGRIAQQVLDGLASETITKDQHNALTDALAEIWWALTQQERDKINDEWDAADAAETAP